MPTPKINKTLTPKNKLFIGILIFGLIVNLLVIFNLNYFYIRAILAFVFLITIPGLLIMFALKIRNINFWEYLVYTVGLSVAFIMFAGLAVNWILPFLNVTDKPLQLKFILPCFDFILLVLWLVAQRRNEDNAHILIFPFEEYKIKGKKTLKFIPQFPSLSWLDRIFIIIPFLFPFMAVIGAFLLNNHGTNIVTMIMLGAIAVYVFCVVLFMDKLNENVYPWALWMIGLSLLLSFSMRSWFVLGADVNQEVKVAKLVLLNNHWTMNLFQDAYNACLSLAIFSPILRLFLNVKIDFIFKLIIQIVFSILPVMLYLMYKKIINNKILIFLASFFFISQIFFIEQMPALIRQEIAFIFFGLFFLLLFSDKTSYRTPLLFIFGFSIIVSHYSTSYIFLFSLLGVYLITLFIKKLPKYNIEIISLFSLTLLIILLVFGFLWTSQITKTSSGLTSTVHDTITKAGQIFDLESRSEIIQSLTFKRIDYSNLYKNYSNEIQTNYKNNPRLNLLPSEYNSKYINPSIKEIKNYKVYKLFFDITFIVSSYFKLLIVLGIFICILFIKEFKRKDYFIYAIFFFVITLLIAILPYISFRYNFERVFLQSLIFLSITIVYAGHKLFNLFIKNYNLSIILISILLTFFLLLSSLSVPFIFLGGKENNVLLDNYGIEFNRYYTSNLDTKSLEWINIFYRKGVNFYFDKYAQSKVLSTLPSFKENIFRDITPQTIDRYSYVYSSHLNRKGVLPIFYGGISFNIEFPTYFLNNNKNKIYNNGGSEIFR